MQEVWKSIKGFENLYEVSDLGNVKSLSKALININNIRSITKEKILTPCPDKDGYLLVGLHKDKKQYMRKVHRLVGVHFVDNPENKPEINHKDGIKTNNIASNIEWVTKSENGIHAYRTLGRKSTFCGKLGALHSGSKAVLQYSLSGEFINEFAACSEASRETGVLRRSIGNCCSGNYKTAGGYIWRFK